VKKLATLTGLLFLASCGQQIENLHDRVDKTNRQVKRNKKSISELYDKLDVINMLIDDLTLKQTLLTSLIGDITVNQDKLQNAILVNNTLIVELQSNTSVKEVIDPCGDMPNQFDEVLLVMNDSSIIAYFEQGSKRFLTILEDGNYRTTDLQACDFSVLNGVFQEGTR